MTDSMLGYLALGLFISIALYGMTRMRSPRKNSDSYGSAMQELQKILQPEIKHLREAKTNKRRQDRKKKKDDMDKNDPLPAG